MSLLNCPEIQKSICIDRQNRKSNWEASRLEQPKFKLLFFLYPMTAKTNLGPKAKTGPEKSSNHRRNHLDSTQHPVICILAKQSSAFCIDPV